MPKVIDNPRYNVVSARLSDAEKQCLETVRGSMPQSDFARAAILEKIERDRSGLFDVTAVNQVD
jgi:hypothetical protein